MASITGTSGNDSVSAFGVSPGVVGGVATALADTILGLGGDDILDGAAGNDSILGGDGFDRLFGGDGNDTLIGGIGTDWFRGGGGDDSMVGGGDQGDVVMYNSADVTGPVTIDIGAGSAIGQGTDTLVGINNAHGSNSGDSIVGSSSNQYFFGRSGNDIIRGMDGSDNLIGGSGADLLDGGGGTDNVDYFDDGNDGAGPTTRGVVVNLSAVTLVFGADTVAAGRAIDNWGFIDTLISVEGVNGSSLNDALVGDDLSNFLSGNLGNDTLLGGGGNDFLRGGIGNDSVVGGADFDVVSYTNEGAPINATVVFNGVSGHSATVTSAEGVDTLSEFEALEATIGNDFIQVSSSDPISGFQTRTGFGNDTVIGTTDRSIGFLVDYRISGVTTGVVVDLASETASNDGFGGQDSLVNISYVRGTDFGDTLLGTDGTDRFRGRGGNDYLDARGGDFDILDYAQSFNAVSVNLVTQRAQDGEGGTDTIIGFEEVRASTGNDTIIGTGGAEQFQLYNGNDQVNGAGGQDRVIYNQTTGNVPVITQGVTVNLVTGIASDGWGGTDTLTSIERVTGTSFADSMVGGAEGNRFRGRAGNDTLNGGLGGDFAEYNNATEGVTVNLTNGTATDGEGGTDRLVSIEHVIGSNHADHLTGVAQAARSVSDLRGGAGNDTLVGITGQFVRADYADQTIGLSINLASGTANDGRGGTDTLINIRGVVMFGEHADTLLGTAAGDWFSPSEGADSVDAGGGLDIVSYGGTDTGGVSVNLATSRARDTGGATDTILGFEGVSASFGNDTIIGNDLGNLIGPGGGADSVNGGGGADTISYTLGYTPGGVQRTINEAGDRAPVLGVSIDLALGRATDTGGSIDTILGFEHAIGSTANDVIRGSDLANYLGGAEGNDTIEGRLGNDTLDGGLGLDQMLGGAGNDTYVVEQAGDAVIEALNQGTDAVRTTLAAYTLGTHVENLVAIGNVARSFNGNALANAITGGGGNDTLNGGDGADTLNGSAGVDRLAGGLGNDTYILDATLDVVAELAGQGIDTVRTTRVSLTLAANVENVVATNSIAHSFTGNELANALTGNTGADTLQGAGGNDTLDGGAGIDRLLGGVGNDVYRIDATDVVVEDANAGIDRIVVLTGTGYALTTAVEDLVLSGATLLNGTGNGLANAITGNANANILQGLGGNDTILGGGGNDTILGGGGQDVLTGGAGNDHFRFTARTDSPLATPDRITDFTAGADRIDLRLLDGNAAVPLAFVAGAPTGAGQVGVVSRGGTAWQVQVDLDGGGADVAINLTSASGPTANWFLL